MSFRDLRRSKRGLTNEEAWRVLQKADHGVFSTISVDTGHPYGVFVNHVVIDNAIYFHAALKGHKIDNIVSNDKVSFTAECDTTIDQEGYTTKYKSAVVFGKASIIEEPKLRKEILFKLSERYVGKHISKFITELAGSMGVTAVIKIEVEHIEGKFNFGKYLK